MMQSGALTLCIGLAWSGSLGFAQVSESISANLRSHQYNLAANGRDFLLAEASTAHFFLLGELHGDNETPGLLRDLWPSLYRTGYRHTAAELSPWAAHRLEFEPDSQRGQFGLWSQSDATFVAGTKARQTDEVLWGCDIEEIRPEMLLRELAAANPKNQAIQSATKIVKHGYERRFAPELLTLVNRERVIKEIFVGGRSLQKSLIETLEVEVDRMSPDTRLRASERRERLMKEVFVERWSASHEPKVLLRFGRNHLHRGYDRRGVSTLGNFVAEFALAHGYTAFNLAVFGAGGKIFLNHELLDWDERLDDPAFAFLASVANFPATVFDLRPIRQQLHRIPSQRLSPAEASLIYWADSYDAILCFREVTPLPH